MCKDETYNEKHKEVEIFGEQVRCQNTNQLTLSIEITEIRCQV